MVKLELTQNGRKTIMEVDDYRVLPQVNKVVSFKNVDGSTIIEFVECGDKYVLVGLSLDGKPFTDAEEYLFGDVHDFLLEGDELDDATLEEVMRIKNDDSLLALILEAEKFYNKNC